VVLRLLLMQRGSFVMQRQKVAIGRLLPIPKMFTALFQQSFLWVPTRQFPLFLRR
jgi:hypothetical protein